MGIPRGEVGQRALPEIFMFDAHGTRRTWREGRMLATTRLETRFLVGRYHEVVRAQRHALPGLAVEVENTARFLRKTGGRAERSSCDAAKDG